MSSERGQHYRWSFGAGEFDESALKFTIHGRPVGLEPKPLKLFALLLRNAGEVVTREEIQAEVWDDRVTVANTIPTAIGKLRRALDAACTIWIETVPRSGYRIVGDVERVAVGRVAPNRLSLAPGDPVPLRHDWILAEQINATVYSDVWLALDKDRAARRVFKFAIDGGRLSRLKREAALNRLLSESFGQRDEIAPMVDTNFSEPPFFLAYDYEGVNLREWADSGTRFAGMGTPERLQLFSRICAAVSAAHGIGVLHKDIKPENVLIAERDDGSLAVKLGDFGNSELLEPEQLERLQLTADGAAVTREADTSSGTFMYMAPELLHTGTATVRSDIFALGVVLFQLLTGDFRRTLTPGWRREIDDELLIDDIATATDHDPVRRPASVDELAARVRNLDDRRARLEQQRHDQATLEHARRELEKQRARRPWVWGLAISLALGLGLSLYLYREAEQGRRQAEAFIERMAAVQQFLSEDVIGRANPLDPEYDPDAGIASILDAAAKRIQPRFGDSPRAAAALHRSVAGAFAALRRDEPAFEHFGQARALYAEALGPAHPTTARVGYEQADVLNNSHAYDQSRALLREIDRETNMAFRQYPDVAYRRAFSYARLHAGLHDVQTAVEYFEQARDHYRESELQAPAQLARLELALVDAYIRLGQPERARTVLENLQASDEYDQLPADVGALMTKNLARVHRELGNDRQALEIAERAVEEMTALYGEAHYQTITTLSLVAQMQSRLDDCDGTLATSQKVFELMRELYGADNSGTLIEQSNLGTKQFACDRAEEGIVNLRVAIDGLKDQFGEENRAVHQISFYLAKYLHQTGQHEESLAMLDHLVEVALDKTDGLAITAAEILLWRGRVLAELGQPERARTALERAARHAEGEHVPEEIAAEVDAEFEGLALTGEPSM